MAKAKTATTETLVQSVSEVLNEIKEIDQKKEENKIKLFEQNPLARMQSLIKAPKGQYNTYGKYKYRKAEDIMEAAKPICNSMGYSLTLQDEVVLIGDRFYIKAIAMLDNNNGSVFISTAYAREEDSKKGMDAAQVTGSSSSYARKYALSGLFSLDDNADPDQANPNDLKKAEVPAPPKEKSVVTSEHDGEMKTTAPLLVEEGEADELSQWQQALEACKTMEELLLLYNANKEVIEKYKDIKMLFSKRKTLING